MEGVIFWDPKMLAGNARLAKSGSLVDTPMAFTHLFPGLDRQALQLVERVAHGERVTVAGPWRTQLMRVVAERLSGRGLLVRVPRQIDGYLYGILSLAEQCGEQASHAVLAELRKRPGVGTALNILDAALAGRKLVLADDEMPHRSVDVADRELRNVFEPTANQVNAFLETHACVRAVPVRRDGAEIALPGEPRSETNWDSASLWVRCGADVEVYTLAVTAALLGYPIDTWLPVATPEDLALGLWDVLAAPQRELVGLLLTHGREIPRGVVEAAGVRPRVVDRAIDTNLIGLHGADLVLDDIWHRAISLPSDVRASTHKRLGEVFATLATPVAQLEVYRHFAAVPDVERAREHAWLGVHFLLQAARRQSLSARARNDRSMYEQAVSTYRVVLDLDEQMRRDGESDGISARPRAYARHYHAYNRYRADLDQPGTTLLSYREAVHGWPENALFWSRVITGCFVVGDYSGGWEASCEAFANVPDHPDRNACLLERTVRRLLQRNLLLAALVAWNDHPRNAAPEAFDDLNDRVSIGWNETLLWAPDHPLLRFRQPIYLRIEEEPHAAETRRYRCAAGGEVGYGARRMEALAVAVDNLHRKLLRLLERPANGMEMDERDRELVDSLNVEGLRTGNTPARWLGYLAHLRQQAYDGVVTQIQRTRLLEVWTRAVGRFARLRFPAVGRGPDGQLDVSWAYVDLPGKAFTVEILPDGRIEWFFRNRDRAIVAGTSDEPDATVPDDAIEHLAVFSIDHT